MYSMQPVPIILPVPVSAQQPQSPYAALGQLAGYALLALMIGGTALMMLILPTSWTLSYVAFLDEVLGTSLESTEEFSESAFGWRMLTLGISNLCTLAVLVLTLLPLLGVLAPRYWKVPVTAGLLWFFGPWLAAAALSREWLMIYLQTLDQVLGVCVVYRIDELRSAGIGKAGMDIFMTQLALLGMLIVSALPLLGLLAPRFWKIPATIVLLLLCGGWIAAAALPREWIVQYVSYLDATIGAPVFGIDELQTAGIGRVGMDVFMTHIIYAFGLAFMAGALGVMGGGIWMAVYGLPKEQVGGASSPTDPPLTAM